MCFALITSFRHTVESIYFQGTCRGLDSLFAVVACMCKRDQPLEVHGFVIEVGQMHEVKGLALFLGDVGGMTSKTSLLWLVRVHSILIGDQLQLCRDATISLTNSICTMKQW